MDPPASWLRDFCIIFPRLSAAADDLFTRVPAGWILVIRGDRVLVPAMKGICGSAGKPMTLLLRSSSSDDEDSLLDSLLMLLNLFLRLV